MFSSLGSNIWVVEIYKESSQDVQVKLARHEKKVFPSFGSLDIGSGSRQYTFESNDRRGQVSVLQNFTSANNYNQNHIFCINVGLLFQKIMI